MKKAFISIVMLTALVAFGATQVEAANPATIDVTVTITASDLSVSVSPGTWPIGSIIESATPDTLAIGPSYFTATNDRNDGGDEDLTLTVASSADWTAAITAGPNQFAMMVSTTGAAPFDLDAFTGAAIATGLAAGSTQTFDLQLLAPTSTTVGGTAQTIPVTLTAS